MNIRIAGKVGESIVDGPGFRYTIFTQGCPHNCNGCHNPQTHDFNGGHIEDTDEILCEILRDTLLDGVTYSGGEPFCQCEPLYDLSVKIHEKSKLNIISYTGFTFEYLMENADDENMYIKLLSQIDYLVDGKFELDKRSLELRFRGSSNQRFIDVKKSFELGKTVVIDIDKNDY